MLTEIEDDVTSVRQVDALKELIQEEVVSIQHRCVREIIVGSPHVRP